MSRAIIQEKYKHIFSLKWAEKKLEYSACKTEAVSLHGRLLTGKGERREERRLQIVRGR